MPILHRLALHTPLGLKPFFYLFIKIWSLLHYMYLCLLLVLVCLIDGYLKESLNGVWLIQTITEKAIHPCRVLYKYVPRTIMLNDFREGNVSDRFMVQTLDQQLLGCFFIPIMFIFSSVLSPSALCPAVK